MPNVDNFEADTYDELLLAEPWLPRGMTLKPARIVGHKHDNDGNPVGTYHHNPMMNTRVYLAEFADGHVAEYGMNVIAKAIYNQVDDNGFQDILFKEVIGHQKNGDAMTDEAF